MCGIFAQSGLLDAEESLHAAAGFAYRGPDGTHVSTEGGAVLVQHRLAIIDPRAIADQPFWNTQRTIGVLLNGEIYNFKQLRDTHFPGHSWRTEGDTEVVLHLYEKYGTAFTQYLDGMYAIVVLDTREQKLHVFRDSFGIKPLYYAKIADAFVCASEVKGVVAAMRSSGATAVPRTDILDLYLTLGYVPAPATIVEGVEMLMPGTCATYDFVTKRLEVQVRPLSIPEAPNADPITTLQESIIRHTVSDVPFGLFLSGGIDSTFILHTLAQAGIDSTAFTLDIPNRPDAEYAKKVAAHYGMKHSVVPFTKESFSQAYADIRERIDQPTADSSILPTYALALHAKERVKVVLSGEGADEVFFGYTRHAQLNAMQANKSARSAMVAGVPRGMQMAFAKIMNDPYSYYALAAGIMPTKQGVEEFARRAQADGVRPVDFDLAYYLENDLLRKIDLGTMYASLEGRVPFCSPSVLAAARQDEAALLKDREPKAPLKERLAQTLPHELVYRPKSGFSIPFAQFASASAVVQEDAKELENFIASRFAGDRKMERALAYSRKNHYLGFALLALMHSYRNLGL